MIFEEASKVNPKNSKLCAVPNTEVQLFNWIKSVEDHKGIAISQSVISEKAREINISLLENLDHKFPNGWFLRFCNRFSIKYKKCHGDGDFIDIATFAEPIKEIQNITRSFPVEDVYNSDETSFYYKQIAKGSYCANKFIGMQQNKERLTLSYLQMF